ncbi:hypothetical protein Nepgr_024267 [Nepenthes gracilis]|uniref:30S ribosomal protein S13, chloroplastic n=1 Tax=Nepenthes gracilis TaxID=150966 RepID=A0AAD3XZV8_NEPGR|nr:hypothetical protein Nepgr_024267 [Nepenthes gracilis]
MAQAVTMPLAPSLSFICNTRPSNSLSTSVSFPNPILPKVGRLSIKCVRVGGVEIPNNKRVEFSLQYIHGIGRTRARQILVDLNLENKITKDLNEDDLIRIREEVSKYMIEGDLRRFNALAIRRLKEIQCYRGVRHIRGLPCRGQRTKNNCRTLKGKRVAIAGKKKAPGIFTSATSNKANNLVKMDQRDHDKGAVVPCRVIAGQVKKELRTMVPLAIPVDLHKVLDVLDVNHCLKINNGVWCIALAEELGPRDENHPRSRKHACPEVCGKPEVGMPGLAHTHFIEAG